MKTKVINGVFTVWASGLICLSVWGIGFAIFNLVTGNYSTGMSFEF
jgi:hypothetical protein